jgi:hypothetical protein
MFVSDKYLMIVWSRGFAIPCRVITGVSHVQRDGSAPCFLRQLEAY